MVPRKRWEATIKFSAGEGAFVFSRSKALTSSHKIIRDVRSKLSPGLRASLQKGKGRTNERRARALSANPVREKTRVAAAIVPRLAASSVGDPVTVTSCYAGKKAAVAMTTRSQHRDARRSHRKSAQRPLAAGRTFVVECGTRAAVF